MQGGWEASRIQISGLSHVTGTSTSTEIKISPSVIMKNHKIGFCAFPIARTAKVSITDPP